MKSHRYKYILKWIWSHPDRLMAFKSTVAMALVSIPFILLHRPFIGVTLALGALAGALAETDDHPRGRLKTLLLTIASFFASSLAVALLHSFIWIFLIGFVLSTIAFILIGGVSERYRAVTFGSILIGIYAMLGAPISPNWYWQPLLLPLGAMVNGIISLAVLYIRSWRPLEEQLAKGYLALSAYLEEKANLFPSSESQQAAIRNRLALLNIGVVNTLEKIKDVLNNYGREIENQELLRPYLQRFMLLQSLHERASSSHERYEILSVEKQNLEVLEGFGEMLQQLSHACKRLAQCMLRSEKYRHPVAMEWIVSALDSKLKDMKGEQNQSLVLLHHNLSRTHASLKNLDDFDVGTSIPRLAKDERTVWQRLKSQLNWKHPRLRYAVRLSISFFVGYVLVVIFQLEKGAWVMLTSLFVSQITYSETRRRLSQRTLGTVLGVVGGVLLVQLLPTMIGQMLLMLSAAMAFFYWLRTNYSVAVVFITIFVLCAFNLISAQGVEMMLPRLVDTFIGAGLAFLTIRFLWPGWQYRLLPHILSEALLKNVAYFKAILNEYKKKDPDDFVYRVARRQAHLADNDLAISWRSMRLEPKGKQQLIQPAFTLTYLNHALLSYLSALGAHRDAYPLTFEGYHKIAQKIEEVLTKAGNYLSGKESGEIVETGLEAILLALRERIQSGDNAMELQQIRLFYNIVDVSNKLLKELENIRQA